MLVKIIKKPVLLQEGAIAAQLSLQILLEGAPGAELQGKRSDKDRGDDEAN